MLKNVNSGLYMEVSEENASNSANVQQWTLNDAQKHNSWKAVSAGNGYYYLYSQLGDGDTFVLDVSGKKTEDGTNVEIYTYKGGDNQQFRFEKNDDGSYTVFTKISGDASCVEVTGKSTETGCNIQQWTANGGNNQKWILEKVNENTQPDVNNPAGDINLDGEVNVADAVKLQRYLLGTDKLTAENAKAADVNNDGYIDVFDMIILRRILLVYTVS